MNKILTILIVYFSMWCNAYTDEWKVKNKWKVSCGIVDNESLVVNGKQKTKYNKKEFKLESVIFKLDKGEIGSCSTDKKPVDNGRYQYSGRQEITHKLPIGHTIFETDFVFEGPLSYRSTIFQIHDGRNRGAPPSWIGIKDFAGLGKIIHMFPKGECSRENCKIIKFIYLKQGVKYRFKADIQYEKKSKHVSIRYYINNELILQHLEVPIAKKKTDGPYGPNKPYIKIGIYRIGEQGTQTYYYNNLIIKNKKNEK